MRALFREQSLDGGRHDHGSARAQGSLQRPGTAAESNWSRRLHMTVARLRHSRTVRQRMKLVRALLESTGPSYDG